MLGLTPPYYWADVRSAYRTLTKKWHPDRHPTERERAYANERMKEINNAYASISAYYKAHHTLPDVLPRTSDDALPHESSVSNSFRSAQAVSPDAGNFTTTVAHRPKRRGKLRTVVLVCAILLTAYLYVSTRHPSSEQAPLLDTGLPDHSRPTKPEESNNWIAGTKTHQGFARGSTTHDVLLAQGNPTHYDDNVWHYGHSKIVFANGVVDNWVEHPDHPFRKQAAPPVAGPALGHPSTFGKGSTMSEVRSIQGEPFRAHDSMWEYGASRVYFENGHVTAWYESPLTPLRTHH